MVDFTGGTWRSLIDGLEVSDIPDAYLKDDFGDNPDELTEREGGGTTTYNGVEGVYRPEWQQFESESLPKVENERLQVERDEYMLTPININLDEPTTWEFDDVQHLGSGARQCNVTLFAETDTMVTGDETFSGALDNGYFLRITEESENEISVRLQRLDGTPSDAVILIDGGLVSTPVDIAVSRDENGNWELFYDEDSQSDPVTDTTYEDVQFVSIGGRDHPDFEQVSVDVIKVR